MNSTNKDCITYMEYAANFSVEESRVIGIIHLFLCYFCIISYLVVLSAIITNNSLNKIHAYRIMVHLAVMDMGELLSYFLILAIMMMTNSPIDYLFNKVSFFIRQGYVMHFPQIFTISPPLYKSI